MKWVARDWLHMQLITYACVLYVSVFICVIVYLCMHMPDYACTCVPQCECTCMCPWVNTAVHLCVCTYMCDCLVSSWKEQRG